MNRIYWSGFQREVLLRSSELGWLLHLAAGPAMHAWDLRAGERVHELMNMLVPRSPADQTTNHLNEMLRMVRGAENLYAEASRRYERAGRPGGMTGSPWPDAGPLLALRESLTTALRIGPGLRLKVAGYELDSRQVELNTALVAGSDAVALAAKVCGWVEGHCWIEGPDRAWAAGIIREAVAAGVYRRSVNGYEQGWDDVVEQLESGDDTPIVLSSSAAEVFPDAEIAGIGTRWYLLEPAEQWETALAGLRESRPLARLTAETLRTVTFGPAVTVFDLFAPDRDERVRAAFEAAA